MTSARSCGNKTTPAACSPTTKPWNCASGSATGARKPPSRSTSATPTADVPALRDLDQAEHWYQHRLGLLDEHDTLGRARTICELGNIAHERFNDARAAGAPGEQLLRYLNDSADAYHQALGLIPDDAIGQLAVAHHSLGNVYGGAGDTARALGHYQPSSTASAKTTATAPAGPVTTPPSPSRRPGAVTTRCYTPAPPSATTTPSAPAPPPAPMPPASSSPPSNRSHQMTTTPPPATPPNPAPAARRQAALY